MIQESQNVHQNVIHHVAMAKQLMAEAGYPNGEGFPVLEYKTTSDLIYIQVRQQAYRCHPTYFPEVLLW